MKLLLQVSTVDGDLEAEINYAIVEISDEVKQYLVQRLALFNAVKQISDDLADLRFWGCDFITFYNNLDLSKVMDEDEENLFGEQGYWEVPDDFANDEEAADWELVRLVLDGESCNISANENDGVEIITRDVPFTLLGLL
jgi:hypothetical protein